MTDEEMALPADRAVAANAAAPVPVSPVPASIPSADGSNWTRRTVAVWEEWSFGPYRAFKTTFDGPWNLRDERGMRYTTTSLQDAMSHAQAIEARRAETETGSAHESAVRKDAP